jgi:hypothetical protein
MGRANRKQSKGRQKPCRGFTGTELLSNLPGFKLNNKKITKLTGADINNNNGSQTQNVKTTTSRKDNSHTPPKRHTTTELLCNLSGFNLSNKNFRELTRAKIGIGNQVHYAKTISSRLQSIFKTHIKQSGIDCQYYSEDKFRQKTSKLKDTPQISIFHLNIRSLNKNHKSLQILLTSLNHDFDVICLSELWNVNLSFLKTILPDYKCKYQEALSSKIGGVAIFYKKGYKVEKKTEYKINPNNDTDIDVDDLWMHIETDQQVKMLLGVIYRHPKGNITPFNDKLSTVLKKIHDDKDIESCFLAGDFNIDIS